MSCNNYSTYYGSYCGYPTSCSTSYYNKNCCYPCKTSCTCCTTNGNPCQTYCPPVCSTPQVISCPAPTPTPKCPNIIYITGPSGTSTVIAPSGVPIPPGSTGPIIPANTVTLINSQSMSPTTNIGGILLNNGLFTIPVAGRYDLSASVFFDITIAGSAAVSEGNSVTLYIYRMEVNTNSIYYLGSNTAPINPSTFAPTTTITSSNVSTIADLQAGDRIFFAATHTIIPPGTGPITVGTSTTNVRYAISRQCTS